MNTPTTDSTTELSSAATTELIAPATKTKASTFAATLKQLPGIAHLAAIELLDDAGEVHITIENKPGQTGSLAVYNHLGQIFGAITPDAAKKGLDLYAEHTDDARQNPGKHPNIDRLIALVTANTGKYRLRHRYATGDE
jgi:hypothetical protein